jgi:hypothetical protein
MFSYVQSTVGGHACYEDSCVDCSAELGECCHHCPLFSPASLMPSVLIPINDGVR